MIRSEGLDQPYRTSFTNGSFEAVADVPIEKGGAGEGFGPHDLIEAALATCIAMTVRMAAAKHGFPLQRVRCEVRIDRSQPEHVTLNYDLTLGGPLTAEQQAKLREAASRCPVARTLTGPIRLHANSEAKP